MENIGRKNLILVGKAPAVLSGSSPEKIEFCTVSDIHKVRQLDHSAVQFLLQIISVSF